MTCYCENRDCTCTPEIVAAVERIYTPEAPVMTLRDIFGHYPLPNGWTEKAAALIVTPLTFGDAMLMAREALAHTDEKYTCAQCEYVARTFMAVDSASRKQAQEYLIGGIAALGIRADEEGDQVSRHLAAHLIAVAKGEELPAPERGAGHGYGLPEGK